MKWTDDPVVKRLRAVMAGAILFSVFITLAGQPRTFWRHPERAMRGDGLGIHNPVNHTFEFFLGHGWLPYALCVVAYLALAVLAVSILPRKAALVTCLALIFGHFFGASQWLGVRWHLGFVGAGLYAPLLGAAIAWAVLPIPGRTGGQLIKRLRWVMLFVMLVDPTVTLLGEPGSYWANPATAHEGNSFWRWFMVRGWADYVAMDLLYCLGAVWLASNLPRFFAVMTIVAFTLGHFLGAANWLFYDWRLGMQAPVIYGAALSAAIVFISPRPVKEPASTPQTSSAPTPACC